MTRLVMIVAGGTGGHVYPGIAVAEALRKAGCELVWMGSRPGIESRVVPAAGLPFVTIPVSGLRRRGMLRWLTAPVMLAGAIVVALAHTLRLRPGVVLGMGGYVSGPGGIAAWLCRRPLVIHEQNAIAGLTNRLLSRLADRVLEAVPGTFDRSVGARTTGNPVRAAIANEPVRGRSSAARRVLVFGGSRGARRLNEILPEALGGCGLDGLEIIHQCGAAEVEETRARYARFDGLMRVDVVPFIEDMAKAYAAADLVVARAGAITVAELAAAGKPAILVPYPYAVDDHQSANAAYLVDGGAAELVQEADLHAGTLGVRIAGLLGDEAKLAAMAARARRLARPDAARDVARHCLEYLDVR